MLSIGQGRSDISREQASAAAAAADGLAGLERLSKLGCDGKFQGNLFRDLWGSECRLVV